MKKKILIIDDDNDTLDLFEIFLFEKFEVYTALNGFNALSILKNNTLDVVLTDIMMPVMDGIKFLKKMKQNDKNRDIPVIAITSFSTIIQERSLKNVGFSTVLSKPISRKILIESIEEVLGDK